MGYLIIYFCIFIGIVSYPVNLARDAFRFGRETRDRLWNARGFAIIEPVISGLIGAAILWFAWLFSLYLAPLIVVSPILFGWIIHRHGRHAPEGQELLHNLLIRATVALSSVFVLFLFATEVLDDDVMQWRWILCWIGFIIEARLTAVFLGRQRQIVIDAENMRSNRNRRGGSSQIEARDVHDWSAEEAVIKALKEEEEQVEISP